MLDIDKFQKNIGLKFKNKSLLITALTHKSFNQKINNEKLEFLGDRVIGLVLSKKLLDLYPNENEGVLDKRFAKLVNKQTCCNIALKIKIQNYILISDKKKKITFKDEKILSDACEALIGAIYIDRDYEFVKKFVLKLWQSEIKKSNVTVLDAKTKLQEYSLKRFKKLPFYKLISTSGPRHNPIFEVKVSILGSKQFVGYGSSKQQAEQNGAENLLKEINII
tara:strand:- start:59 stop:724 length:666 start_codon:yes stop_codon:yes gene_type:complete